VSAGASAAVGGDVSLLVDVESVALVGREAGDGDVHEDGVARLGLHETHASVHQVAALSDSRSRNQRDRATLLHKHQFQIKNKSLTYTQLYAKLQWQLENKSSSRDYICQKSVILNSIKLFTHLNY